MPDFPRKKNDILILAAKIVRGIVDHPAVPRPDPWTHVCGTTPQAFCVL